MNKLQIAILVGSIGLFSLIYFGSSIIDPNKSETVASDTLTEDELLLFANSTIQGGVKKQIKVLRDSLQKVVVDIEKQELYKELHVLWYNQSLFGVSGIYAEKIADFEQTDTAWSIAGVNYARALYIYDDQRIKNFFYDKAVNSLETVLRKNPNFNSAKQNLANIYIDHSPNVMQGVLMMRDLLKSEPNNIDAHMRLADLSFNITKDYPKAINRLKIVLEIQPDNQKAKNMLAECYRLVGKSK